MNITRTNVLKKGFTLSEVLITVGIIGIVAAMTLPSIIQANKNIEVSSKLKKIYSTMNQAILMSEKDNGPKEYWEKCIGNNNSCESYYKKYFLPYLKETKTVEFNSYGGYNIAIHFSDGSVLVGKNTGGGADFFFFPNAKWFNSKTFGKNPTGDAYSREGLGISYFIFGFYPVSAQAGTNTDYCPLHKKKGFEPYLCEFLVRPNISQLKNNSSWGCNKNNTKKAILCTALIQSNNWNIPKDYPFKVK